MTDLLLKWPDRDTAVAFGAALGCTAPSANDPSVMETASVFGAINLAVIGQHSYVSDDSDLENVVVTTVPGWWVLVRVPDDFDLAAALAPLPETLRPEIVWSSDSEEPRPPIESAPTQCWA